MEPHKFKAAEIQSKHHRLVLNYRGQDRFIQSELFVEAWNHANEDERKFILNIFPNPNPYELKRWILKTIIGGLEQYPVNILRQLASYHRVMNYCRMTRAQLLEALEKKDALNDSKNF